MHVKGASETRLPTAMTLWHCPLPRQPPSGLSNISFFSDAVTHV